MALYDDDSEDDEPVKPLSPEPTKQAPVAPKSDGSKNITMKFLQSQVLRRPATTTKTVVTPVIDLAARNKSNLSLNRVQPMKAVPLADSLTFLPKTALDESVMLFGEVVVKCEYQPSCPNDYTTFKRLKLEREAKEKIAKEVANRLAREHKEESKKREKGAAIAPPTALMDDPPPEVKTPMPPPSFLPSFGKGGNSRGLGVAANIMSKFGYKEGSGLGRDGQGISTALSVERVGKNTGIIVDEHAEAAKAQDTFAMPTRVSNTAAVMNNSSKVLLLTNIVGSEEVDDELENEIKGELGKYGQIQSTTIHKMENKPEEETIRIFVEFTNVAQSIKAYVVMNGRFFGGRQVVASFYNADDYSNKILNN